MNKKQFGQFITGIIVPPIISLYLMIIALTVRVKIVGERDDSALLDQTCVMPMWHGDMVYITSRYATRGRWLKLILRGFAQGKEWVVLVSPSADGNILNGVQKIFNISTARGSTFENPRGSLIAIAKKVKLGFSAALVADGSRGPARKAQMGSVYVARLTGAPIIPVAYDAQWKKEANSWDKTIFPLPFSKINMAVGKTITVGRKADKDELEAKNMELEAELNRITKLAGKSF